MDDYLPIAMLVAAIAAIDAQAKLRRRPTISRGASIVSHKTSAATAAAWVTWVLAGRHLFKKPKA